MEPKKIFPNGTATFINGPANLLNNEPKNPPDWIPSFISVAKLLLNPFLNTHS